MTKKTTRFDLINNNFRQMSTCISLLHEVTFDLYAQGTLHHVSKHDFILRTNQVIDVRYKK